MYHVFLMFYDYFPGFYIFMQNDVVNSIGGILSGLFCLRLMVGNQVFEGRERVRFGRWDECVIKYTPSPFPLHLYVLVGNNPMCIEGKENLGLNKLSACLLFLPPSLLGEPHLQLEWTSLIFHLLNLPLTSCSVDKAINLRY